MLIHNQIHTKRNTFWVLEKLPVKNKNFVNSGLHGISQEPNMGEKGKNWLSMTIG